MQAGGQGRQGRAQQQEVDRPGHRLGALPLSTQAEGDGHRIDERHLAEQGTTREGEHRQIQHIRLAEPIEQGGQRQDGDRQQQGIAESLQGLSQDLSGVLYGHKRALFCDAAHSLPARHPFGDRCLPFIEPFIISDQINGARPDPVAASAG
ncbi:hypothetical protein D3C84_817300 [compost metagenome]